MLIRYGYRLELHCASPTLFTALLDAHRDHAAEIKTLGTLQTSPRLDVGVFTDVYGIEVTRFVAPAGVTTISRDAVFEWPRTGRITVAQECDATNIPLVNFSRPHTLNAFEVWTEELSGQQAVLP